MEKCTFFYRSFPFRFRSVSVPFFPFLSVFSFRTLITWFTKTYNIRIIRTYVYIYIKDGERRPKPSCKWFQRLREAANGTPAQRP